MTHKSARHLSLLADSVSSGQEAAPAHATAEGPFAQLARSFAQASGWELRLGGPMAETGEVWSSPIDDGDREPSSKLSLLAAAEPALSRLPLEQVRPLALALANLLSEQARLRNALWQREAELAAGVPVAARPDDAVHLAKRLAAILKGDRKSVV